MLDVLNMQSSVPTALKQETGKTWTCLSRVKEEKQDSICVSSVMYTIYKYLVLPRGCAVAREVEWPSSNPCLVLCP